MGSAWFLSDPPVSDLQFAAASKTSPSTYRAKLLAIFCAIFCALSVSPDNCNVHITVNRGSIMKHASLILSGFFDNQRNIFKQRHFVLWLSIVQLVRVKRLTLHWYHTLSHLDDPSSTRARELLYLLPRLCLL